ncbi:glycosyltransferase family 39 protein [candidate division KSB1 bacterium]|nr:glycosyltransferase family 39 protein [candidate division KSB1 bacterium]
MLNNKNKIRYYGTPACILLIAALLRLFFIFQLPEHVQWSDEENNLHIAENVASGKGYVLKDGKPTAIKPPGYPLLLAVTRLLGGETLLHIRLLQVFISVLTILLAGIMTGQLFDYRTALLAMVGFSIYPYFIYLPGTILATGLFCALVLFGMWLYYKALSTNNNNYLMVSGFVWGVAALTVSTAVVLAFVLILWQLRNSFRRPRAALSPALFVIAFLMVTVPWMVRNNQSVGIINLASNGGYNFWLGNNPGTDINNPSSVPTPDELQQRLIRAGEERKQDAIFMQEAWRYIKQAPVEFCRRTLVKAVYFWRLDPSPVTASYIGNGAVVRLIGWLSFAPVLILAILGFRRAEGASRTLMLLCLWMAIAFTAIHAVMIVKVRFRLPLDQFFIMAAAYGAVNLWNGSKIKKSITTSG